VPAIDPTVREAVRALPLSDAYVALTREDASAAARLAPADSTRIRRALEVVRATGRPITEWQERRIGGIGPSIALTATILLPERETLRARCDARLALMVDSGALREVEALLARRLPADLPVMRAIGVPDLAAHIAGEITLDEALTRAQAATRQYAKRQFTWFRHQPPADWEREMSNLQHSDIANLAIKLREKLLT
jgi:tRNA dimethylallyltransferase